MIVSPFVHRAIVTAGLGLSLASCSKSPTTTNSQAPAGGMTAADYTKRIGIGVRTDSRTCVLTTAGTLPSGSPITLVIPSSPQRFVPAEISDRSTEPCPIAEELPPGSASYRVSLPPLTELPKMTPFVAVMGSPDSSGFAMDNLNVQADIDHTHSRNTFRACGANDGVYLTVWRGVPLTGTRLWTGHYYQTGTPGDLPSCTAGEMSSNSAI